MHYIFLELGEWLKFFIKIFVGGGGGRDPKIKITKRTWIDALSCQGIIATIFLPEDIWNVSNKVLQSFRSKFDRLIT
uniref:Uncharacterized protein n=1 Tax=Gossypium raimondii TaxID=29730 RepID=A0A0D2SL00_GOSRA|nr:hypothetical protein B456_007G159500 [Gossypium raimondii]